MKKQFNFFPEVSGRYGAPMGRRNTGNAPIDDIKTVRVFRVRLDSGGYDDGGAYWGHGQPIYCATDGADYFATCRADSRLRAIVGLDLPASCLKTKGPEYARLRSLENQGCISASGIIFRQQLQELGF